MTENENTAWLISWLESKISDYTYYRPHHKWIRYPVQMKKMAEINIKKDETLL